MTLRLPGNPGPTGSGRLALVVTNEGPGQLGQNKSSNSQFDGSAEFLGLSSVGPMVGAKGGCFNIDGFLEWSFGGNGDWPGPFTYEWRKSRYRKETNGNS